MKSKKEFQITLSQAHRRCKIWFLRSNEWTELTDWEEKQKDSESWKISCKLPSPIQHNNHQQFPQMLQNLDKQL